MYPTLQTLIVEATTKHPAVRVMAYHNPDGGNGWCVKIFWKGFGKPGARRQGDVLLNEDMSAPAIFNHQDAALVTAWNHVKEKS